MHPYGCNVGAAKCIEFPLCNNVYHRANRAAIAAMKEHAADAVITTI
jgi:hypothetical protein